jgi:hypothetical protein
MLKQLKLLLLIIFAFAKLCYASQNTISEKNKIKLRFKDFRVVTDLDPADYSINFLPKSLHWTRHEKVLLLPQVKVQILINQSAAFLSLRYKGKTYLFQNHGDKGKVTFIYSLFESDPIEIFNLGKPFGTMRINSLSAENVHLPQNRTTLVDYSCTKYQLQVYGIEGHYFSIGCQLLRTGKFGKEKGSLQLHWTAPNFTLLDGSKPPFVSHMNSSKPTKVAVVNTITGKKSVLTIRAKVPGHLARLKTAIGFGPYIFQSTHKAKQEDPTWTIPIMAYANFFLTPKTSFRGFEAFIYNKSYFNNLGIYFAYNVGSAFDNQLTILPLVGFQHIMISHDANSKTHSKVIFPQGFEVVYSHAFGMPDYHLVYGMFLSPSSGEGYQNLWIRFGKRILNWSPKWGVVILMT